MKSKVRNELRETDIEGLKKKINDIEVRIRELEFLRHTKPGKNTREIKNLRKKKRLLQRY